MPATPHISDAPRRTPRFRRWGALGFIASLLLIVVPGAPVNAHTGFGSSLPAEGDIVETPVDLVTIVFTGEATPVGDRFVARDATGAIRTPVSVSTVDNKVFSVRFDPPLAGGQIGVRWNVQAADAHPIEGAFSFTVTAPAPTTVPAIAAGAEATTPPDEAGGTQGQAPAAVASLDDFLAVDNSRPGETTSTIGRLIGFTGVALGLGVLAFAATTLRGTRSEIRGILRAARALGVMVAVGAAVEYVGLTRLAGSSLNSFWTTSPGFATVLRIGGGLALAAGLAEAVHHAGARGGGQRLSVAHSLSAAVLETPGRTGPQRTTSPVVRWKLDARSWPALLAVALIVMSFWFDGHTVSKGIRPVHAIVNSVHVLAGSVWVGGVVAMAVVVWSRFRARRPVRAMELVVRFSTVATIALAAVVLAGGAMAVLVLDSFGELTGTEWGQILLLKTGAVGLAMLGGAYNHFRLLPALEADPDSPELHAELRSIVTAEAIMLTFVVVVTAWLVAAAS